jgi:hypothetical protein
VIERETRYEEQSVLTSKKRGIGLLSRPSCFEQKAWFLQARALRAQEERHDGHAASDAFVKEYQAKFPGWRNENAIRVSVPRLYAQGNK